MTDTMAGSLAALQERAVASETDRVTWLQARNRGVTGTNIPRLAKGTINEWRELAKSKARGDLEPDLAYVKYIQWGRLREEVIAPDVQARTNIRPSRTLFHALDNVRHLATPDGIGCDWEENIQVSEIKTSNKDLTPGPISGNTLQMHLMDDSWRAMPFWSTTYYDQMQWEMYVTGAVRCRFTWEQHDNDWSGWPVRGPKPLGAPKWCWVERDDFRIDQLVAVADQFLDLLDSEIQALRDGPGEAAELDEVADTHGVNYLRFFDAEKPATVAKKREWEALKAHLREFYAEPFQQVSPLARITWNPAGTVAEEHKAEELVIDRELAEVEHPEVFAALQKANLEVLRANQRHAQAVADVDELLKSYTATREVVSISHRVVKENLTVTSPKGLE